MVEPHACCLDPHLVYPRYLENFRCNSNLPMLRMPTFKEYQHEEKQGHHEVGGP